MRTMTTNVDVMKEIVTADNDFVNNKPAMEEMAADESYGDAVRSCRYSRVWMLHNTYAL